MLFVVVVVVLFVCFFFVVVFCLFVCFLLSDSVYKKNRETLHELIQSISAEAMGTAGKAVPI